LKTKIIFVLVLLFAFVQITTAQEENKFLKELQKIHFAAYGVVNYYNFNWDTDPYLRDAFDTERLNMYLDYKFTDKIKLRAEFEYEHGGTGVTMELDVLEEFGEFETEVEAGGEVKIEQLNILFEYKPWLNFRAGRLKLYLGNFPILDHPTDYFTGYRSRMENALLPVGWYENGLEILGKFGKDNKFSYKAYLVNGLNSYGFSSANWIKRGHQKRFEMVNANGLAVAGRFDYKLKNGGFVGVSGYHGEANKNRHKPDLQNTKGAVSLVDFHLNIEEANWKFRAMLLYGNLQNSDKISKANRNVANALNVKRTPVAKNALGYYVEAGYDLLSIWNSETEKKFYLFGRYDYYDSMHKTTGVIINNPRWERNVMTFGANYYIDPNVVFKAHYAENTLGIPTENKERTFLLGMGFFLSTKNK